MHIFIDYFTSIKQNQISKINPNLLEYLIFILYYR